MMNTFDIAIIGAGPVGCILASALAKISADPKKIAVFEARPQHNNDPKTDTRVLAINHGSQIFLEKNNCWPKKNSPIKHVHVSQKNRLGRTVISHKDMHVPNLGSVVGYASIYEQARRVLENSAVTIKTGGPAQVNNTADGVIITQDKEQYHSKIAIMCDGSRPQDIQKTYKQVAIVTAAQVQFAQKDWAWERFTQEGPLAVLPHPLFEKGQSIVWCASPEKVEQLMALNDADFSTALSQTFGERLGKFTVLEKRSTFALQLNALKKTCDGYIAYVGNAAQTLHPVAGQGLNLGLRDIAVLIQALKPWMTQGNDARPYLENFAKNRFMDRNITCRITDLMPRIFTTKVSAIEHLCGLSLLGLDLNPFMRQPLAHHLLQGYRG